MSSPAAKRSSGVFESQYALSFPSCLSDRIEIVVLSNWNDNSVISWKTSSRRISRLIILH
jgi:hypothetical protein